MVVVKADTRLRMMMLCALATVREDRRVLTVHQKSPESCTPRSTILVIHDDGEAGVVNLELVVVGGTACGEEVAFLGYCCSC